MAITSGISKIICLTSLGFLLAGALPARTWTNKDGKEIEADFVKFDETDGKVTIKRGDKEYALALDALSEGDQKWVAEHASALKEEEAKEREPKGAADAILLLLNKSPDEVATALKTLKMVEDMGSVEISKRRNLRDDSKGVMHTYDSGKVKFEYFGDKLTKIDLCLIDGYAGAMPLGLSKNISQEDVTEILKKQDFKLTDWGTSPPGWGMAHSLNSDLTKVVSIMTLEKKSPELAVIRIMQK